MSLFDPNPEPQSVEIAPGTKLGDEPTSYEAKRARALLFLGAKWCLADTRKDQLQQIINNGEDLV